ncbi:MAG: oxygenase MpaB family protein [Lutibacter sp.]
MIKNTHNDTFWENGNGKDFLNWANLKESDLNENFDEQLFYQYDTDIDFLVENWLKDGPFKKIMQSLHRNIQDESLPPEYLHLKNKLAEVPDWVDFNLIEEACKLSERSGLDGLMVLRNFALLGGYQFANLTKPLIATGSLEKGSVHRLYNTLGFWVDVSRTDDDGQKKRVNACLRTRLVHSASRIIIQEKQPDWDKDRFGIPINHADMIATNIAFTVYYLYGLEKLNFIFSEKEEAGIFHLWKYVTWLLSVPEHLIPNNRKEAINYFYFWTKYQGEPDEDARKLSDSLLNENTPISILKLDIIKRNMGYIHKSVSNYLIDETIRKNLEIPAVRFKFIIPNALRLKNKLIINKEHQMKEGREQQRSVLQDYKNNI